MRKKTVRHQERNRGAGSIRVEKLGGVLGKKRGEM